MTDTPSTPETPAEIPSELPAETPVAAPDADAAALPDRVAADVGEGASRGEGGARAGREGGRRRDPRRRRANRSGRTIRHEVWVTPEEEALLVRLAAAQGVTVSRLLYEGALAEGGARTDTARERQLAGLLDLRRLVATIANNINQVAVIGNTTGQLPPHTAAVVDAVDRLVDRLDEQLRQERRR